MHFTHHKIINKPTSVSVASNKLRALEMLSRNGVSTVPFTTSSATAREWLGVRNAKVLVRHKLSSNSGDGIEVLRSGDRIPNASLYTKYLKKEIEFRVHVWQGQVFDFQEKKKKNGTVFEDGSDNHLIRSHLNGWIFCRTGVVCPQYIKNEAIAAVDALDLDFGAVDVIDVQGRAYVLEVNTAPGLEQTTLDNYVRIFTQNVASLRNRPANYRAPVATVRNTARRHNTTLRGNRVRTWR
jgi:hypothetical protein